MKNNPGSAIHNQSAVGRSIVGLDEAGRGPLCGPVVACAYMFTEDDPDLPVKDSKKLNPLKRPELFERLLDKGVFSLGLATAQEIDRINILQATMRAFNRAIKKLIDFYPAAQQATFIVDGNYFRTDLDINYRCQEKADDTVREVSSASIIAKVFRDHLMGVLDCLYPEWQFFRHKGYPTRFHREMVDKGGLTPFHRKTFCSGHE